VPGWRSQFLSNVSRWWPRLHGWKQLPGDDSNLS